MHFVDLCFYLLRVLVPESDKKVFKTKLRQNLAQFWRVAEQEQTHFTLSPSNLIIFKIARCLSAKMRSGSLHSFYSPARSTPWLPNGPICSKPTEVTGSRELSSTHLFSHGACSSANRCASSRSMPSSGQSRKKRIPKKQFPSLRGRNHLIG